MVGATGAISAVRRQLFRPIPPGTLLDDVYWPLQVCLQGYRVVHESRAVAFDRLPDRPWDEFRRKVRTLTGNFQLATLLPAALLRTLRHFTDALAARHGLLPRRRDTGAVMYGFVHGNWALDNSRPDGRHCGVNDEIGVLVETGCYADFTLPSAPSRAQTRTINRIYYAVDDPRPKSHDRGVEIGSAPRPANSLLLIQGPLLLDWGRRKWGVLPRVENGCLQSSQPATVARVPLWLRARVQVPSRPDWFFVKLHTHGAAEDQHETLLGEPMVRFHHNLAQLAAQHPNFHFHYVTAREMYNLARAAEAGWNGSVADARDYELVWPSGPHFVSRRGSVSTAQTCSG